MRNIGTLLLVVLILLAALVVYLLLGPLAQKPGMRAVVEETESPGQAPSPPANALPRRGSTPGKTAGAVNPAESASQTPSAAGMPSGTTVESPGAGSTARNFPTAADIPVGTGKSRLQDVYGKPSMVTTAVDRGRLIETFVYLRRDPNIATVVLMRDGRVVAANSTVY